jgi:uncharacterized protein (TIGR02217 family)
MTFLDQRLDSRIEQGASGGPTMPGRVKAYLPNGRMYQNFLAQAPIHRFDVSHGLRNNADHQLILDTWYVVMMTPYEGFRFRDWRDYRATDLNSRCVLITGATFQLQRVHTFAGVSVYRNITKPCATPAIVITRNRSGAFTTASATIDNTTGIATITGHVTGDTYTWVGEFDIPVTFTGDEWVSQLQATMVNLAVIPPSIKLEEIR